MQSVALHIVAFMVCKRLLCGCLINADDMMKLEVHEECELLLAMLFVQCTGFLNYVY